MSEYEEVPVRIKLIAVASASSSDVATAAIMEAVNRRVLTFDCHKHHVDVPDYNKVTVEMTFIGKVEEGE